jgi:hypothetical protein
MTDIERIQRRAAAGFYGVTEEEDINTLLAENLVHSRCQGRPTTADGPNSPHQGRGAFCYPGRQFHEH